MSSEYFGPTRTGRVPLSCSGLERPCADLMKRCFSRVLFCCALCGVGELFVGGLTLRG